MSKALEVELKKLFEDTLEPTKRGLNLKIFLGKVMRCGLGEVKQICSAAALISVNLPENSQRARLACALRSKLWVVARDKMIAERRVGELVQAIGGEPQYFSLRPPLRGNASFSMDKDLAALWDAIWYCWPPRKQRGKAIAFMLGSAEFIFGAARKLSDGWQKKAFYVLAQDYHATAAYYDEQCGGFVPSLEALFWAWEAACHVKNVSRILRQEELTKNREIRADCEDKIGARLPGWRRRQDRHEIKALLDRFFERLPDLRHRMAYKERGEFSAGVFGMLEREYALNCKLPSLEEARREIRCNEYWGCFGERSARAWSAIWAEQSDDKGCLSPKFQKLWEGREKFKDDSGYHRYPSHELEFYKHMLLEALSPLAAEKIALTVLALPCHHESLDCYLGVLSGVLPFVKSENARKEFSAMCRENTREAISTIKELLTTGKMGCGENILNETKVYSGIILQQILMERAKKSWEAGAPPEVDQILARKKRLERLLSGISKRAQKISEGRGKLRELYAGLHLDKNGKSLLRNFWRHQVDWEKRRLRRTLALL